MTQVSLRHLLAKRFPDKPWLWDTPVRFLTRRAGYALLQTVAPAALRSQWRLPLGMGGHIVCSPAEVQGRAIFLHGNTEYYLFRILERIIQPDFVCVDVGANIGQHTIVLARLAHHGHVHAFEASPEIAMRLRSNITLNRLPNVDIVQQAANNYDGNCHFYINKSSQNIGLGSLSASDYLAGDGIVEVQVPCTRLDTYFRQTTDVGFVKIDVEGHEFEVLRGAEQLLDRCKPIVVFEIGVSARPSDAGFQEVSGLLHQHGYRLFLMQYSAHQGPLLLGADTLTLESALKYYSRYGSANMVAFHPAGRGPRNLKIVEATPAA